jgi:hypothetical protein
MNNQKMNNQIIKSDMDKVLLNENKSITLTSINK